MHLNYVKVASIQTLFSLHMNICMVSTDVCMSEFCSSLQDLYMALAKSV
jgi:hypothetical protein